MDVPTLIRELRALPVTERDQVLEAFREPAQLLSDEQLRDLDRRLAEDDANPDAGEPWDVVKARIQAKA
jgi:putative addiction module component (TIGR02574 family)